MVVPSLSSLSSLPQLSTDAFIIAGIGLVVVYGLAAGQVALMREAISIYVGIVLAATFGKPLYDFSLHSANGSLPVNQTVFQLALLLLPVILLQFGGHRDHRTKHRTSMIATLILAIATAMLLISSVLKQLNPVDLSHTLDGSNLASQIMNLWLVWVAAVPLAIAAAGIIRPREKHH
jgi:hypothetical protein